MTDEFGPARSEEEHVLRVRSVQRSAQARTVRAHSVKANDFCVKDALGHWFRCGMLRGMGRGVFRASVWAAVLLFTSSTALAEALIEPGVREQIASDGRARVLVTLDAGITAPARGLPDRAEREAQIRAAGEAVLSSLTGTSHQLLRRYRLVDSLALEVTAESLSVLAVHPRVESVGLDEMMFRNLDQSMVVVHADDVQALGYDGTGVEVAVIDTGIDVNHTDFTGRISAERCYCGGGCCPNGNSTQTGSGAADDFDGHGTHVSGIVLGDGATAPKGFAPNADLVAIRVFGPIRSGAFVSDIVAGLDWVATTSTVDVRIVNMSLGGGAYRGTCDTANASNRSYARAVSSLRSKDIIVTASSGNDASTNLMGSPGCIEEVISVGSTYDENIGSITFRACRDTTTAQDQIACYSNGSTALDLLAPGSAITAARDGGGSITLHGTSMAAPSVAGCAALLVEARPAISADDLEDALETSNTTITDARSGRSHPRLDCEEALNTAAPDSDGDGLLDFEDNCPQDANADQKDADGDDIGDVCDACPNDAENDGDLDGLCAPVDNCPRDSNADQLDSDLDDRGDACDLCPFDALNDDDEDGFCADADNCPRDANPDQKDDDADGAGNVCDPCPADPLDDIDADFVCGDVDNCPTDANGAQTDTDTDGRGDVCDSCPWDPLNDVDGDTRCGNLDNCPVVPNTDQLDSDADGAGDACDLCPLDSDDDADGDGFCANVDNCPNVANGAQSDADEDGLGDTCDPCIEDAANDADQDGLCGDIDNCPFVTNVTQSDGDGDAAGDACDVCPDDALDDQDGDGLCAPVDNCPERANVEQADGDGDGWGDACDPCREDPDNDADADGLCAEVDNCPGVANAAQLDSDADGTGDACDACPDDPDDDADGDGVCAGSDNCPATANADQADLDADGLGDACDGCPLPGDGDEDADDICSAIDNCPERPNADQADFDRDGRGDVCDPCPRDADDDADGDGICADADNCPGRANADQSDDDGNGIGDACEVGGLDVRDDGGCVCLAPDRRAPPYWIVMLGGALLMRRRSLKVTRGLRARRRNSAL